MRVLGLLVEGSNNDRYLIGIGPRDGGVQAERPTIWRVTGESLESLEKSRTASSTIRENLNLQFPPQPGSTHDEHVKQAVIEGLTGLLSKFFRDARW
jgi:hypothetical protein